MRGSNRGRIIGPSSVRRDYVFSPGSAQQQLQHSSHSQSHLSSPSIPIPSPPSPPAGHTLLLCSQPGRAVFCSLNKRTEGENDVALLVVWINVKGTTGMEGEGVTDCFDGQTLRFFPSFASIVSLYIAFWARNPLTLILLSSAIHPAINRRKYAHDCCYDI